MSEAPSVEIELDDVADCAYITLSDHAAARTVELTPQVMVDLDEMNVVTGIEVLAIDAEIPLDRLEKDFHVHSEVVALIRLIRPNVHAFTLSVTSGGDGAVEQRADRDLTPVAC